MKKLYERPVAELVVLYDEILTDDEPGADIGTGSVSQSYER